MANTVMRAVEIFEDTCTSIQMQPEDAAWTQMSSEDMVPWDDLPVACAFKIEHVGGRKKQRHATPADKLEQQHAYMQYVCWCKAIGISEQELRSQLELVPAERYSRGQHALPTLLQRYKCSQRHHAVQACRTVAYERAAVAAGATIGGESLSAESSKYMMQLLEADRAFLEEASNAVPHKFRSGFGLRKNQFDASAVPGLFAYWLYRRGCMLMGTGALERWNQITRSKQASLPPTWHF
eukprot:7482757-Karenia_brevis.AAC.1